MTDKSDNAYKTIGEVVKILALNSNNKKKIQTHTIRFWEKEFKQIKPKIFIGGRRYYDTKIIELAFNNISTTTNCPFLASYMKRSFPVCTFKRCCTVKY